MIMRHQKLTMYGLLHRGTVIKASVWRKWNLFAVSKIFFKSSLVSVSGKVRWAPIAPRTTAAAPLNPASLTKGPASRASSHSGILINTGWGGISLLDFSTPCECQKLGKHFKRFSFISYNKSFLKRIHTSFRFIPTLTILRKTFIAPSVTVLIISVSIRLTIPFFVLNYSNRRTQ